MRATLMNWRIESLLCVGKVFCTIDGVLWIYFSVQLINEALSSLNRKTCFSFARPFLPIQPNFNPAIMKTPTDILAQN